VSLSCGSLWFMDAGSVTFIDEPVSNRYLTQDDRTEIADGLADGEPVKSIAATIGELPDHLPGDRTQRQARWPLPAFATRMGRLTCGGDARERDGSASMTSYVPRSRGHSTSTGRRHRSAGGCDGGGHNAQAGICATRRSTRPSSRAGDGPGAAGAAYWALLSTQAWPGPDSRRCTKQCTNPKSIHTRPAIADARNQVGHWEDDLLVDAFQRSAIATLVDPALCSLLVHPEDCGTPSSTSRTALGASAKDTDGEERW
jgi:IS30 family transposase